MELNTFLNSGQSKKVIGSANINATASTTGTYTLLANIQGSGVINHLAFRLEDGDSGSFYARFTIDGVVHSYILNSTYDGNSLADLAYFDNLYFNESFVVHGYPNLSNTTGHFQTIATLYGDA